MHSRRWTPQHRNEASPLDLHYSRRCWSFPRSTIVATGFQRPVHPTPKHEAPSHGVRKMEVLPFQQGKIPQQEKLEDGTVFPTVLLPQSPCQDELGIGSLLNAIRQHKDSITDLLQKSGALLFRGFPVKNAADFNAVVEAFGWEEQPYLGAASRKRIIGRIHTANEAPLYQPIQSHHEMSLFDDFPTKLIFFCEVAPPEGGQTAVILSHKITQRMEEEYPEIVKKLEKKGLIYISTFPQEDDPNSVLHGWQTHFQTKDKEEAERKAVESGFKTRWLEDGSLEIITGPHGSIRKFDRNRKAWFNLIAFNANSKSSVAFGDGSVFPLEAIQKCLKITVEESVEVNWQVGDVLLLDNRFVQHARRPSKPPRRILAAFCK